MKKLFTPVFVVALTANNLFAVNPFNASTTCAPCQMAAAFKTRSDKNSSTLTPTEVAPRAPHQSPTLVNTTFVPTRIETSGAGRVTWTLSFTNSSKETVDAQIQLRGFTNAQEDVFNVVLRPGETKTKTQLVSVGTSIPKATMVWNTSAANRQKKSSWFTKKLVSSGNRLAGTFVGQSSTKFSNGLSGTDTRELTINSNLSGGLQKVSNRRGYGMASLPNIKQHVMMEVKNESQISCNYDSVGSTWGGATRQFTLSDDGNTLSSAYHYTVTTPALKLNGQQEVITGTGVIELKRVK